MQPGFTRNDLINKVKRAFYRMTPSRNRREGASFMLIMNIAPLMGRRDAAYQCAIGVLKEDIFSIPEAERCSLYKNALELIDITIKTTDNISASTRDLKNEREKRLLKYFSLLFDLLHAALALVDPAVTLQNNEADFQCALKGDASQIRQLEDVLNESEINIIQSINNFIAIFQSQLTIDQEVLIRNLSRQNQERYTKSFEEFKRIYCSNIQTD